MKRTSLSLVLLLATGIFLISACYSRRDRQATTNTGATGEATATSSPQAASSPEGQTSPQPPASSQASRNGWWIRINTPGTTAQAITFQIGTDKFHREEWRVWRTGEPAEFDVPEKYLQAPRLYLRGSVTPIGTLASLCMMYKDRGVEHMSFDDDDSETKSQVEVDFKCRQAGAAIKTKASPGPGFQPVG
jgi:hypothetical protein